MISILYPWQTDISATGSTRIPSVPFPPPIDQDSVIRMPLYLLITQILYKNRKKLSSRCNSIHDSLQSLRPLPLADGRPADPDCRSGARVFFSCFRIRDKRALYKIKLMSLNFFHCRLNSSMVSFPKKNSGCQCKRSRSIADVESGFHGGRRQALGARRSAHGSRPKALGKWQKVYGIRYRV